MSFDRNDAIMIGGQLLSIQRAVIEADTTGDNEVVAAQSGKRIMVLAYTLMANGTVNARWRKGTTSISGRKFLIANTGLVCNLNKAGWVETGVNQALNLNLSDTQDVEGELLYVVY